MSIDFSRLRELNLRSGDHEPGPRGGLRIDNYWKDIEDVDEELLSVVEAARQLYTGFLEEARFSSGICTYIPRETSSAIYHSDLIMGNVITYIFLGNIFTRCSKFYESLNILSKALFICAILLYKLFHLIDSLRF